VVSVHYIVFYSFYFACTYLSFCLYLSFVTNKDAHYATVLVQILTGVDWYPLTFLNLII